MQARFYLPQFGRFTAPDPARDQHFEDTQSWNIYSYVRNSPVMSTDPTGMVTQILAPNQRSADDSRIGQMETENADNKTKAQTEGQRLSALVPNEVKKAIQNSLNASNAPTADDKKGGFHEEGGQSITTTSGAIEVHPAVPGAAYSPGASSVDINLSNLVKPIDSNTTASVDIKWHIHPAGETVTTTKIKGGTRTDTFNFAQPPSDRDKENAFHPINIVVGARDKTVYFYDQKGVTGTIPLSEFMGK